MLKNKKVLKTVVKTVVFATVFFVFSQCIVVAPAYAGSAAEVYGTQELDDTLQLAQTDIRVVIARIIRAVLGLLGIIAVVIIIIAGFTIMTAGGNPEKIVTGKKILINATIGLAIIMSAFAIVQFVLNALVKATGATGPQRVAQEIKLDTFSGSGGLGRIVLDHYPFRNEVNVPRNAGLAITFAEPIDLGTLIEEGSDDDTLGNCREDDEFSWAEDCDKLKTEAIKIFFSTSTDIGDIPEDSFVDAVVLTNDMQDNATVFTIKPLQTLGSSEEEIWYTVYIDPSVQLTNGKGIYEDRRVDPYFWEFQTGTELDETPPHVRSVIPGNGSNTARNYIVQVNFDEPMDPTAVASIIGEESRFINIVFHERAGLSMVEGEWRISNGYRTIEFMSDIACGQNSCGEEMYCLPYNCVENIIIDNENVCVEPYEILIRSAFKKADNWEAIPPFLGAMDISGNALDGGVRDQHEEKPEMLGDFEEQKFVQNNEKAGDNYWWTFNILNEIDMTAPKITRIEPRVDEENVRGNAPLRISFSKPMWSSMLMDILLEEYPEPGDVAPIWFVHRSEVLNDQGRQYTRVEVLHREFGPNHTALYYYPIIPSTIKSLNQNCFYPGLGPEARRRSDSCNEAGVGCMPGITINADSDSGCASGNAGEGMNQIDPVVGETDECLVDMRENSPVEE